MKKQKNMKNSHTERMVSRAEQAGRKFASKIAEQYIRLLEGNHKATPEHIFENVRFDMITEVCKQTEDDRGVPANAVKTRIEDQMPEFDVRLPQVSYRLPARRYGFAAAIGGFLGCLIGMFMLSPLMTRNVISDTSAVFLSTLAGAALMSFALSAVSTSPKIRIAILGAVGVGTIAELWSMRPRVSGLLGAVRKGGIKRMLCYGAAVLFTSIAAPQPAPPGREVVESAAEKGLKLWFLYAYALADTAAEAHCMEYEKSENEDSALKDVCELQEKLGAKICKLFNTTAENLDITCMELIQQARRLGFENLEGEPTFRLQHRGVNQPETIIWSGERERLYDCFGPVEPGDRVVLEDEAVLRKGEVVEKGVVRKPLIT